MSDDALRRYFSRFHRLRSSRNDSNHNSNCDDNDNNHASDDSNTDPEYSFSTDHRPSATRPKAMFATYQIESANSVPVIQ